MRHWLYRDVAGTRPALGLLMVRLVMGTAFILHGWGKVQTPFSWMPGGNTPGYLQAAAAFSEFGGGIALILGVLTPVAAVLLAITMAEAVRYHCRRGGTIVRAGGRVSLRRSAVPAHWPRTVLARCLFVQSAPPASGTGG